MAVNGVIEKPGDVDHFVYKAEKGQVLDVHCYARRLRSPLDPIMYLGKKGAGAAIGADDAFGPDSYWTRFKFLHKSADEAFWRGAEVILQGDADYKAKKFGLVLDEWDVGGGVSANFKAGATWSRGVKASAYIGFELVGNFGKKP